MCVFQEITYFYSIIKRLFITAEKVFQGLIEFSNTASPSSLNAIAHQNQSLLLHVMKTTIQYYESKTQTFCEFKHRNIDNQVKTMYCIRGLKMYGIICLTAKYLAGIDPNDPVIIPV